MTRRDTVMLIGLGVVGWVAWRWWQSQPKMLTATAYTPLIATPGATGTTINPGPLPISSADLARLNLLAQGYTQLADGSMVPPGGII
jgi:hypothetical protein